MKLGWLSLRMLGATQSARRDPTPSEQQPEDQDELAEEGERGQFDLVASEQQISESVDEVAEPSNEEQDAEDRRRVDRPIDENGQQNQVYPEENESGVPDVVVRVGSGKDPRGA